MFPVYSVTHVPGLYPTDNLVQGNLIGTDVTGTTALGNGQDGVVIRGEPNNTIGGTTPGARNVISANNISGVRIQNIPGLGIISASGNLVLGNFIGTHISGRVALGNRGPGVSIDASANNTIGGIQAGARNLISGNRSGGLVIRNIPSLGITGASGNLVLGNFIGTDISATVALGNRGPGVRIDASADNTIGGTTQGAANLIAANSSPGVLV